MTYIHRESYDFGDAFDRVADIVKGHGIGVEYTLLPGEDTGTFDGKDIFIDTEADVSPELRLFLLSHLFGHTIQWNIDDSLRELGLTASNLHQEFSPELIARIKGYEEQSSAYGLTAFHEAGVYDLDQWLADQVLADWKYLDKLYKRERVPGDYSEFFVEGAGELLTPLPIPHFTPRRFEVRQSF